ncbi:hypothetical protein [Hylemonella gracilis]|uniref:hypothetical protein n=1 Tax=Hylemonella gracilis TaxID=80880 RepID=UPI0012DC5177|nr:hypothetical protein [Hylemonella gracilis]
MSPLETQTLPLPLLGGVVQAQTLHVPPEVLTKLVSYRQACRMAWKLRRTRITQRTLAELCGLYASHVSEYFSLHGDRRELPARYIAVVESAIGNTVISQWIAQQSRLTVLEVVASCDQAARRAAA